MISTNFDRPNGTRNIANKISQVIRVSFFMLLYRSYYWNVDENTE